MVPPAVSRRSMVAVPSLRIVVVALVDIYERMWV
jgi:hypothetical protein